MDLISKFLENGYQPSEIKPTLKPIEIDINKHWRAIVAYGKHICPKSEYSQGFELTPEVRDAMGLMLRYFTGSNVFIEKYNEIYDTDSASLSKGLMIVGIPGVGKSVLFKIFKEYTANGIKKNSFKFTTSSEIMKAVDTHGVEEIDKYVINPNLNKPFPLYIDDIAGNNEDVNSFGTKFNVMEQLITDRYVHFQRIGVLTHVSTNLLPTQMSKIYDARIIDRMREMFNVIEIKGKSFRK